MSPPPAAARRPSSTRPRRSRLEREEYAPHSPYLREGLPHIAAAAERDGAQVSAHDIALRSELSCLPTEELLGRRSALGKEAEREARVQGFHRELQEKIDIAQRHLDRSIIHRETVEEPRRERKRELPRAIVREANCREHLELLLAEARRMEPQTNMAPVELAIVNQILAERRELAVTAARLSPPPTSQRSWGNAQRSGEAEDLGSGGGGDRGLSTRAQGDRPG